MQALSFKSDTKGVFDFDFSGTSYNFLRDYNNTAKAYGLLPNAAGTAYSIDPRGSNVNQTGTFWRTFDLRGIWRPEWTDLGKHEVSIGAHWDLYSLAQTQTNTNVFTDNYYNSIQAINYGKTETKALYLQDVWWFAPKWKLTFGGREEFWSAFGGVNNTLGQKYTPGFAGYPPSLVTPPYPAVRRQADLLAQGGDRISSLPRLQSARLGRPLLSLPDGAGAVPEYRWSQFRSRSAIRLAAGKRHLRMT